MESQTIQSEDAIQINENLTPHYIENERYRLERERLKTFENWPLEWLDKNVLATTGMFYTGMGDTTKCYFCEVFISKWERKDDPVQEHLRWSPHCPLLRRRTTDNISLNGKNLDLLLPPANLISYDIPPSVFRKPLLVHDYSLRKLRLYSFADWPRSIKQKPEELVDAGFYYKGIGDCVICFSCLGGLKDWEEDDDPWEQHALWMGHYCPYVKLIKGEEYIKSVNYKWKNFQPKEAKQNSNEKKSSELDDQKLCKICFDKECSTAYVPCGHVVACPRCALSSKDCPVCRASIESVVRLYFS